MSQEDSSKNQSAQADQTKSAMSEFFATMRYELRTPLNSIIGYCEILLEDTQDQGLSEFIPDLEKIHAAGNRLLETVNTTLDPAKIEADATALDLETVAATIRHDLRTPLNAIIGYGELLLEEAESRAQKRLIPDLQRIHTAAGDLLKLVNSIINLSHIETGPLESGMKSQPTLPAGFGALPAPPQHMEGALAAGLPHGSVLIVDDDPLTCVLLSRYLERLGLSVVTVPSGHRMLEIIPRQNFDLMLLDIRMPEMDGFQVLEHFKSDPTLRHIPVIMVSALAEMESVVRCIEMGAEDYLLKPFNTVLLRARIGACIEKKRLRDLEAKRMEELAEAVERLKVSEMKAHEASQAKSAFLSNMSHELRTPLNAIIGFAQLLDRNRHLNAEAVENVQTIIRSGEHLLGLINDVLSLSKIEAGKVLLTRQTFDLKRLLQGVTEMIGVHTKVKRLTLSVEAAADLPQYVVGDEGKLRQILINLLGNAVKFTDQGGVTLRASWLSGRAAFAVTDTGQGIDASELGEIFEAFVQSQSGQKSGGGTGLGLTITQNFVHMMGGDITVQSVAGQGTTFSFDIGLPLADQVALQQKNRRVIEIEPGQKAFRLLVVDNKPDNRTLLNKLLASVGFEVREAENGQQAVEMWERWRPDLIWMDMRMPVMGGIEATKLIRQKAKGKRQKAKVQEPDSGQRTADSGPSSETLNSQLSTLNSDPVIIALTASVFEQDRAAILEAGCDDYVAKPFREFVIFDKLEEHLSVRFVYESRGEVAPFPDTRDHQTAGISQRLAAFPPKILAELTQALKIGDMTAANEVIDHMQAQDEWLADEFRKMAKAYQFDELIDLLGPHYGEHQKATSE